MESETARHPPRALPPIPSSGTVADEIPLRRPKKKKSRATNGIVQATNRRPSESREPLTPEPVDVPSQRKRKKKKSLPTVDSETSFPQHTAADAAVFERESDNGQQGDEIARKSRKRSKKTRPADINYTSELGVEEDDIISEERTKSIELPVFTVFPSTSQPVGKVFVEKNRRFDAADWTEFVKTLEQPVFMDTKSTWTTRDAALTVHRGFRLIGLCACGILSGFALWNIIIVYVLCGTQLSTPTNLLEQYQSLAYPAQSLLYLLLAVSTVSAFDRLNLAKASTLLQVFLTLDPAALASFFYFAALVLSLSQQMTSDRINFYPSSENNSLWASGTELSVLRPWIVVNLVVTILVGLAWIVLSSNPEVDYSEELLFTKVLEEYPETDVKSKSQS
ncbi:transmembrane protein 237 isoform X2 [Protopterus annectens]|uniref:transmembrane protein 237 isoform X2 n=1 Tax=Protopterus annectens TaxID=7888 RepID=UPI001CF9BF7E|nr:transmembrane protein 237 isoform X2 [Protopterus annectens]